MIKNFECINIGSKNPKGLADFYQAIGVPVYADDSYDGCHIGNEKESYICVWDENRWGKSSAGFCTFVFKVDDLQKTYDDITAKGITIPPIKSTDWGGQELSFEDPDGNKVILLT